MTAIAEQSQLKDRLEIPPEQMAEFERIQSELDNVMTTANDVMERLDTIDVLPDIPMDEWLMKLEQFSANITFLENNCDY